MIGLYKEALSKKNPDMRGPHQYFGMDADNIKGLRIKHESLRVPAFVSAFGHAEKLHERIKKGDRSAERSADVAIKRRWRSASRDAAGKPASDLASKPKPTRKGKMLAAGGALAAAGLGAYAYKKHLDKKREEANGK